MGWAGLSLVGLAWDGVRVLQRGNRCSRERDSRWCWQPLVLVPATAGNIMLQIDQQYPLLLVTVYASIRYCR